MNVCLLLLTFVFVGADVAQAQAPPGWLVAGSRPQDYDFLLDSSAATNGRSALIAARPGPAPQGFATLMQVISAENYRGRQVRLSGYLKTESATRAQMWMRVDGPDHQVLAFDNMDSRPVTGTTGWKRYEVVLGVPADSVDIAFGFLLTQGGKVWGHDFKLEKVAASVPATAAAPQLPKEPVNMDFQTSTAGASTGSANHETDTYKTDWVDTYDIYRAEGHLFPRRTEHIRPTDRMGGEFYEVDKYNLCGMHVVTQTKDSTGTTLRWDMKLNVTMVGGSKVASLAAGAYEIQQYNKELTPRRAITHLTVQLQGEKEPAETQTYGDFPEAYAEKLFDAFDVGTPFTLDLTYDSGDHESVVARAHGGNIERNGFFHGTGAPVRRCLNRLVPASEAGVHNRLVELSHPQ